MNGRPSTHAALPSLVWREWAVVAALALSACESGPLAPAGAELATGGTLTPAFAVFSDHATEAFGTFDGIAYERHTGLFEGETSLGAFRMPYEILAPSHPSDGNGTLLVEPPHFAAGLPGRNGVLGHDLLFGSGYSHAAVGYGENLRNILDPTAGGLVLAGAPVAAPGTFNPGGILDEEIVVQFTEALATGDFGADILGVVDRRYAYGVSQTSSVLLEAQRSVAATGGPSTFDLTLLHVALWQSPFPLELAYDHLSGDFEALAGVGRVLFVGSEGDQVISAAEQFRSAVGEPDYRVYEVAGAAHQPTGANPLAHAPLVRALLVAGDAWVREGIAPPQGALIQRAQPGELDAVYGFETGIARDDDLNALGGVRLPDLAVGRAQYIASDPSTLGPGIPPPFAIITGSMVDLACQPAPGEPGDEPRFGSHGDYVRGFVDQVNELERRRLLLAEDAEALRERAAESAVGFPGSCPG